MGGQRRERHGGFWTESGRFSGPVYFDPIRHVRKPGPPAQKSGIFFAQRNMRHIPASVLLTPSK